MFIGVSCSGGVADRSNAAVLKIDSDDALGGIEWHLFRESGTEAP